MAITGTLKSPRTITLWIFATVAIFQFSGGEEGYEYPPYDGWYNNRAAPDWGAADTHLIRRVPPAYGDGVYEPAGSNRPNPIAISQALMNGSTGHPSYMNRTALLVFFGQQVVEEILDAQRPGCPPEYFNIPVPAGHPQYDPHGSGDVQIPLLRSRYDMRTGFSPNVPREQLNEITAWIDGGLMYGVNKAWADALRSFKDGLLAATNDTDDSEGYYPAYNDIRLPMANPPPPRDHMLKPIKRFFKLGNPRGNENAMLLTFGILWFRWHNLQARRLKAQHPDWSDEKLFNEARKWTIATHQNIVAYDWLPAWLGEDLAPYTNTTYDPSIHPGITHIFQSAAMRFGHTLVPPGVYRRDAQCNFRTTSKLTFFEGHKAIRTCNTYWNPQEAVQEADIDEMLMGMASQITEREDNIITPDLRGDVFGPLEFLRRDLMAVNIQRARDHGLPDYNTARETLGLDRITDWYQINPTLFDENRKLMNDMKNVYHDNLDIIDIWAGGLLETTAKGPGELFTTVIKDQFRRIRDGDRFWFENYRINKLFTKEEVEEIKEITLYDVIIATTNITPDAIQKNPFFFAPGDPCPQEQQLNASNIDELAACTPGQDFDYFDGSELSFILSFLALFLFLIGCICSLIFFAKWQQRRIENQRKLQRVHTTKKRQTKDTISVVEWLGSKEGERDIEIKLDEEKLCIAAQTDKGRPLRTVDLKPVAKSTTRVLIIRAADRDMRTLDVRIPKEYDLVLKFDTMDDRELFCNRLTDLLGLAGVGNDQVSQPEKMLMKTATTKETRKKLLEKFFRVTIAQAFNYDVDPEEVEEFHRQNKELSDLANVQLSRLEFAEVLDLKPNSKFVQNLFEFADENSDGYLSFREFMGVLVIFSKGSATDRMKLLFDMYDVDKSNHLSRDEFQQLLRSLMEQANETMDDTQMKKLIDEMFASAGFRGKEQLTFEDFQALLKDYERELGNSGLNVSAAGVGVGTVKNQRLDRTFRKTLKSDRDERMANSKANKRLSRRMESKSTAGDGNNMDGLTVLKRKYPRGIVAQKMHEVVRYIETYRYHIFWVTLYTLVVIGIFAERAYYYSVEREHAGLRRIAGYGVTVTRGAASGMMFTYSCCLVTMCRNVITFLRETFMHRYIPFDAAIPFHKYIAFLAALMTITHCIGHGINFYHIASQTANDLTCLFRNYFHATDELPKFHYWCWNTLTGFTGVLSTLVVILMYVFAVQYSRRHVFRAFWATHSLYIVLFILMFLHGAGRLVQPPFLHYFALGPIVLFTVDKLISLSRKKVEIPVKRAELLPSDVTCLQFQRPSNFEYKSGQWVRIAMSVHNEREYHPFTLTSAPHEENLSLHIRAVGPWTMDLRKVYDPKNIRQHALPKIYLDGPYGEGHQDWYKFEVAVLVGGGIGVTPFASILKDLVHKSHTGARFLCKKVYFLWVTRTQKQFEWMTDIIRHVEERDSQDLVSVHIFITQFKEKFDFRTTMLYICERYFQKISSRSLFTGLRSITHFGRPDFSSLFEMLHTEHKDVNTFGVFSCGPPPMTHNVESACQSINKYIEHVQFIHHYENF